MRKLALTLVAGCLLSAAQSRADDAANREMARELGSVLAWRLGPETVEEACRSLDPGGVEARSKALKAWQEKNTKLIQDVDARVAEIVPLAYPSSPHVDAVQTVYAQVRKMLLEPLFAERTPEESSAICRQEADPANPRWKGNGSPHVQQALAALYDWKMQRTAK